MLPIVTALPPLPSPLSASNMKPFELQQPYNHIQCDVAKIALYSLPSNLRLDSIDFEQCILDCVTNKFLTDQKSSTSSLSSSSSSSSAISQNGLSKRMVSEIPIYPKLYDPSSSSSSPSSLNYTVAIHSKKLWWNVWDSSECPPIDIRDSNNSMRLSFTKIQLCYVNHRMPDLIIWLFFSLPKVSEKDSLKTLSPSSSTSKRLQFKSNRNNSLFALVWKCFSEQDVVHLREVYKHLQSMPSNLKRYSLLKQFDEKFIDLNDENEKNIEGDGDDDDDDDDDDHILTTIIHSNMMKFRSQTCSSNHPTNIKLTSNNNSGDCDNYCYNNNDHHNSQKQNTINQCLLSKFSPNTNILPILSSSVVSVFQNNNNNTNNRNSHKHQQLTSSLLLSSPSTSISSSSSSSSSSLISPPSTSSVMMNDRAMLVLARQRQPAKIIQATTMTTIDSKKSTTSSSQSSLSSQTPSSPASSILIPVNSNDTFMTINPKYHWPMRPIQTNDECMKSMLGLTRPRRKKTIGLNNSNTIPSSISTNNNNNGIGNNCSLIINDNHNDYFDVNASAAKKSESEFDTTQINLFLLNRRNSSKKSSSKKSHPRSRSVDSGGYRNRSHQNQQHQQQQQLIIKSPSSPLNKTNQSKSVVVAQSPKISPKKLNRSHSGNAPLIAEQEKPFLDHLILNSEGSSLSDDTSSGEFNHHEDHHPLDNAKAIDSRSKQSTLNQFVLPRKSILVKSALKKTLGSDQSSAKTEDRSIASSSTVEDGPSQTLRNHLSLLTAANLFGDRYRFGLGPRKKSTDQCDRFIRDGSKLVSSTSASSSSSLSSTSSLHNHNCHHKKNVTFSAYATIQMVDS